MTPAARRGQSTSRYGLRAALMTHLAGGDLRLELERGVERLWVAVPLDPLLPPELLAGSHDPFGTWLAYARDP